MTPEITALAITAASIGFFHTLLGPDHYLPFVMIAQARNWSRTRTVIITFLCGLGHVGSSVILGVVGVAAGIALAQLVGIESIRGEMVAWLFMAFGLMYTIWGVRRAIRNRPHRHGHYHLGGDVHEHKHSHDTDHAHLHESSDEREGQNLVREAASGLTATKTKKKNITPWVLFLIFVFGPCEPLIPVLMYPAARKNIWGMVLVTGVFAATTIATMLTVVLVATFGIRHLPTARLERYSHALAGLVIFLCGASITFLGL